MTQAPDALFSPQVRLCGAIDDALFERFQEQFLAAVDQPGPVVVELTTPGGDADIGRRIAADVRLFRERTGRHPLIFCKTVVYSAGATILAAFRREDRWMDRHCVLMVHRRKLVKCVNFSGFLEAERTTVQALLSEIDEGIRLQTWGFRELVEGSDVDLAEIERRAAENWYIEADEALRRGLIAGVV